MSVPNGLLWRDESTAGVLLVLLLEAGAGADVAAARLFLAALSSDALARSTLPLSSRLPPVFTPLLHFKACCRASAEVAAAVAVAADGAAASTLARFRVDGATFAPPLTLLLLAMASLPAGEDSLNAAFPVFFPCNDVFVAAVARSERAALEAVFESSLTLLLLLSGVDAGRDQKESEMSEAMLLFLTRTRWGPVKSLLVLPKSELVLLASAVSSSWCLRLPGAAAVAGPFATEEGTPPLASAREVKTGPRLPNAVRLFVEAAVVTPARAVGVLGT